MFKNYIQTYQQFIAAPLQCIDPAHFTPFNDDIDIVLSYLSKINECIKQISARSDPALIDVYFAPPSAPTDLDRIEVAGMAKSVRNGRFNYYAASGLDDICGIFSCASVKRMLTTNPSKKRFILLIVRCNEYQTNNDIIYFYEERLQCDLKHAMYDTNEVLLNIISKKSNILSSQSSRMISIDDPRYAMFNVSYHIRGSSYRMYQYYNGFGSRIFKQQIVNVWPLLFRNTKHSISNHLQNQFADVSNDMYYQTGRFLFGLRYSITHNPGNNRRIIYFPKEVLRNSVPPTREFKDHQKFLYYFLSWTCKMQVIDGQFKQYTLNTVCDGMNRIAIFNSELHDKYSNDILYVVSAFNTKSDGSSNEPQWVMDSMMTSQEIYREFGIAQSDLPMGSRFIHQGFEYEISAQNIKLDFNEFIPVHNIKKLPLIHSQKYHDRRPSLRRFDINDAIHESIERINDKFDHLALIPILTIDIDDGSIKCEPLIPIQAPNKKSYYAVSYRFNDAHKAIITNLYIDVADMINKSTLVDPCAYATFEWLNGDHMLDAFKAQSFVPKQCLTLNAKQYSNDSLSSLNSQRSSNKDLETRLNNAMKQINDYFKREQLLLKIMQQKDQIIASQNHMSQSQMNVQIPSKISCSMPTINLAANNVSPSSITTNLTPNITPNMTPTPSSMKYVTSSPLLTPNILQNASHLYLNSFPDTPCLASNNNSHHALNDVREQQQQQPMVWIPNQSMTSHVYNTAL